jgi:putative membrane protein
MLRHMILVALAPPLLVLAWPASTRAAPPVLAAAAAEFVVVWAWHLPALHGLACRLPAGFAAEQALFLAAGWAVWAGALRQEAPPLAGAGGLLLTSMHMSMLGALLTLAPTDLYASACGHPPDLADQQTGALLMLGIGTPVYLLGGLLLAARALARHDPKGLER